MAASVATGFSLDASSEVFATFFPRPLGQLAARVALSPGDAWLGYHRTDKIGFFSPSEQLVLLRDMAAPGTWTMRQPTSLDGIG